MVILILKRLFFMSVKFEVLVNDQVLPEKQRDSRQCIFVQKDQEYNLRVSNYKSRRVLAVITVDGLSIMNGQPGDILSSAGYVIEPNQSINIPGWRLSNDEVAKFYFSNIDKSYAHLIGKPTNIGVIGCAFFAEKGHGSKTPFLGLHWGGEKEPPLLKKSDPTFIPFLPAIALRFFLLVRTVQCFPYTSQALPEWVRFPVLF
jgi:hypothetical protein